MLREVAVENYTDIPKALAAGADRIELNDNLAVGGTTVSK
ncbi:copper homeostasis protein CutC, partial [Lacticaseibacillus rhamnosus]